MNLDSEMVCQVFCFLFLFVSVVRTYPHLCPQGEQIAHDGKCIEVFSRKIQITNIGGKNLFDTPDGCQSGSLKTHDGKCLQPFGLPVISPSPTNTSASSTESPKVTLSVDEGKQNHKSSTTPRPGHGISSRSTKTPVRPHHH